jgi:hypothetical protein
MITDKIELKGSGWKFVKVVSVETHVNKFNPMKIKSYLPLPKEILSKKCVINPKNEEDKCFMWCILCHILKEEIKENPERTSKYKKFEETDIYKILNTYIIQ